MRERAQKWVKGVVIVVVLLLFGLFFTLPAIRYIAFASLTVTLISFLYSRLSILFLTASHQTDIVRGHRREPFTIDLSVENRSIFPISYVAVLDMTGALSSVTMEQFLIRMPPWHKELLSFQVTGQNTGEYEIGPITLSGFDPIGFFPWRKTIQSHATAIVYPRVYPLELIDENGLPAGSIRVNNKIYEDMTQFRSIREYMPGDEMKRINWKVTARMGKLYSTEFLPTLYFPVFLLLNLNAEDYSMRHRDHLTEKAKEVAASLIYYFVNLKQEIGMITTGVLGKSEEVPSAEIKAGYGHALSLLEIISRCKLSPGRADFNKEFYQSGIKLPVGTRIMVISPPLREEQSDILLDAKRKSYDVEYFQIAPTTEISQAERFAGNIKTYAVKDYGDELL